MKARKVSLLPGDLLGRDLAGPTTELAAAAGATIEWEWMDEDAHKHSKGDEGVCANCIKSIRRNGVALKGPFSTPKDAINPSIALRRALDLYAGVRHVRNLKGLPSRYQDVDLVVIRQNTEDVYGGMEHVVHPGVVQSIKVVTKVESERIFRFAYRYARSHGRRSLSIIHKANIMKQSDGLFLRVGREIGEDYPDVETRALIVDNTCMQMVQRPHQFDVLVCPNLYGDIISDLGAGLIGGISAVWGMDQGDDCTVFEAIHGRVPEMIGKDLANPLPMVMPMIHLLQQVGQHVPANRLQNAVETVLTKGKHLTRDLGGKAKTSTMFKAMRDAL